LSGKNSMLHLVDIMRRRVPQSLGQRPPNTHAPLAEEEAFQLCA
jgi:hypothetical protein